MQSDAGDEQVLTPNVVMWGGNAHVIEEIEVEADELTKLDKRLHESRQHVWQRWKSEYIHSLMEQHRVNRKTAAYPNIGEVVLILGDEKNRREWRKGKVVLHIQGRDGVVRGVKLLHKGHYIERPLTLVCSLEIRGSTEVDAVPEVEMQQGTTTRSRRQAANDAREKIRVLATDEDD